MMTSQLYKGYGSKGYLMPGHTLQYSAPSTAATVYLTKTTALLDDGFVGLHWRSEQMGRNVQKGAFRYNDGGAGFARLLALVVEAITLCKLSNLFIATDFMSLHGTSSAAWQHDGRQHAVNEADERRQLLISGMASLIVTLTEMLVLGFASIDPLSHRLSHCASNTSVAMVAN